MELKNRLTPHFKLGVTWLWSNVKPLAGLLELIVATSTP